MAYQKEDNYRDDDEDEDDEVSSLSISNSDDQLKSSDQESPQFKGRLFKKDKKSDKLRDKKKKKRNKLVELEAEEASEEESDEDNNKYELKKLDSKRYTDDILKKKHKSNIIGQLESKYQGGNNDMDDVIEAEEVDSDADIKPPDKYDPKIWRVGCMKGKENEAAMSIMYKYQHLLNSDTPLEVISVFALKKFPAVLFVEAYYEPQVQKAVDGLGFVRQMGFEIVDPQQCGELFAPPELEEITITEGDWVRVRQHTLYQGDLARVMQVDNEKRVVKVKIVPREKRLITQYKDQEPTQKESKQQSRFQIKEEQDEVEQPLEDDQFNKRSKFYHRNKNLLDQKKYIRGPKQAIKIHHTQSDIDNENESRFFYPDVRDEWMSSKRDGFNILTLYASNLITGNVKPTQEELMYFYPDVKDIKVIVRKMYGSLKNVMGNKTEFNIGDTVTIDGVGYETSRFKVKAIHPEKGELTLERQKLNRETGDKNIYYFTVAINKAKLAFSMYQQVVIVNGPNKGVSGAIINMNETMATISTDASKVVQALISDLQVQKNTQQCNTQIAQAAATQDIDHTNKTTGLKVNDLVKFGQIDYDIGCVLSICGSQVKLLDITNTIKNISQMAIQSTINTRNNVARNIYNNEIRQHDQVVILDGFYKNRKAAVLHVYRDYMFLFNGQFDNTQGVIIEKVNNCGLLSSNSNPNSKLKNQPQPAPTDEKAIKQADDIKNMIGQYVTIRKGQWQGYKGLVVNVKPKAATVQLTARNVTVQVPLDYINKDQSFPSAMAPGKTPHHAPGMSTRVWDDLDNQRPSVMHGYQSPYVFHQTPMHEQH